MRMRRMRRMNGTRMAALRAYYDALIVSAIASGESFGDTMHRVLCGSAAFGAARLPPQPRSDAVVTTTTNGSSEVVTENADGYIVDGTATGLATRLTEKISTFCTLPPHTRDAMRAHARTNAERFTTRANAQAIVDLFATKKGGTP